MINLVDTHCHIHFPGYELDPEEVIQSASKDGVDRLICVGCTLSDSKLAIEMAKKHKNIWATIGLHPHEADNYVEDESLLQQFRELATQPKVIAIGECGLDYYYNHSTKQNQEKLLRFQLSIAQEHDLPLIFHVREAFDDFFAILDDFEGVRGVIHSFTADRPTLDKIIARGLYIGLNGIVTFTSEPKQLESVRSVPIEKILLETDAPFLTPVPYRGTICQPKHVRTTAEFVSKMRGESLEELSKATTQNAQRLFNLK